VIASDFNNFLIALFYNFFIHRETMKSNHLIFLTRFRNK